MLFVNDRRKRILLQAWVALGCQAHLSPLSLMMRMTMMMKRKTQAQQAHPAGQHHILPCIYQVCVKCLECQKSLSRLKNNVPKPPKKHFKAIINQVSD